MTGGVNAVEAVTFAARFGQPGVVAFDNGKALHPSAPTQKAAADWITANAERDIYFVPAQLRDAFTGKPRKTDCVGAHWVWADVDPPKGMTDPAEQAAWQADTLAEIEASDLPPPQVVVDSGRGLWLYWHLPRELPPGEIEAINYALAERLAGGDHCHNIDRVARLPGTLNTKTGRIALVLRDDGGTTPIEALPSMPPPAAGGEPAELGDLGEPQPPVDEDEFRMLVAALPCSPDRQDELLLAALDPAASSDIRGDDLNVCDRSAVMFSWAIRAIMAGMEPRVVRDCILSPAVPAISAHLLDPRKVRPGSRARAAARQVARAIAVAQDNGWSPSEPAAPDDSEPMRLVALAPVPQDLPARPWLVENLLMDGQVTMLTGRGGDGKSLLALQVAVMVAARAELAWWQPRERRNVLVLNAEDNLDEQRRRLLGACETMEVDPRLLEDRLFTLERENLVLVHRDPEDGQVKPSRLYTRLARLIEERGIGLVVIDPLVEAHINMDENSNADMKELVVMLRRLARARAIPLLLVHHSRKGASGGDQDGARGGSALVNACRIVVTLDRMSEQEHKRINPPSPKERYVRVTGAKANYAGRIGDRWLEVEPVELKNGDPAPGLRRVEFGQLHDGFDVQTWEHRDELLKMVKEGRENGRSWSTATTGRKAARLDAAVAQRFNLDAKQALDVLTRFETAKLIARGQQKGDDRKISEVWLLPDMELPEGTSELPF